MQSAFVAFLHKHGPDRAPYPISNRMSEADALRFVREWRASSPQFSDDVFSVHPVRGAVAFAYGER